jgi:hypothetical protein
VQRLETSADDVQARFLVTPQAVKEYNEWTRDESRRRHGVVDTVLNHVSRSIYNTTSADLAWIKSNNSHPLRRIKKEDVSDIIPARDWEPAFAFSHIFYYLTEEIGRPPLWQEYDGFLESDPAGRRMMGDERIELRRNITEKEVAKVREKAESKGWDLSEESIHNKASSNARDALDWRVGNAYYGIMRDVWTVTHLREKGLQIQTHPLADALFRTDAWIGNTIVSLYVKNPFFKDESGPERHRGRKRKVEDLFRSADVSFRFESITMEAAKEHGTFHVPTASALQSAEEKIRFGLIENQ